MPNYLDEAEFTHIRNEAFEGGKGLCFKYSSFFKNIGLVCSYVQVGIRIFRIQLRKSDRYFLDIRQLDEWYVKDDYSVPALYKLKPIQDVSKNRQLW